ncbi:WD40 repeat domain-containing protein [Sorangium sp. So ce693]|uniref:WD40 repeat domain-containing protein n=1 Tax=Sorangium sp. So ce693 TaxID=3133318 RepID=UPI003F5DD1C4
MVFYPRCEIVVSGSSDGTVRAWEAASGKALRVLGEYADAVECVAMSPDGRHVAAACTDGMVRVYRWASAT